MESEKNKELKKDFSFWFWFFKSGFKKIFDRWIILHIIISTLLTWILPVSMIQVSSIAIIPLVSILIGLSFAWVGNAMALLETTEIEQLAKNREGGLKEYLFSYQLSILILLTCIIAWSLIGLRIHEINIFSEVPKICKFLVKIMLFILSCLAIRECWQVVLSTQWLLLSKSKIRIIMKKK